MIIAACHLSPAVIMAASFLGIKDSEQILKSP